MMYLIPQTHDEKIVMYLKLTKRELAEMLVNANLAEILVNANAALIINRPSWTDPRYQAFTIGPNTKWLTSTSCPPVVY